MEICRDPLWNSSTSWNTTHPTISSCLQSTLEVSTSLLLLLTLPLWLICTLRTSNRLQGSLRPHPRGGTCGRWLLLARSLTSLLVTLTSLLLLTTPGDLVMADIAGTTTLSLASLSTLVMELVLRSRHCHTSHLLTCFWSLLLLSLTPHLLTLPELFNSGPGGLPWEPLLQLVRWVSVLSCVILQTIPNLSVLPQEVNPEMAASSISNLTFGWLTNLVWKGWRRPLVLSDLPSLKPEVEVTENVATFRSVEAGERSRHVKGSLIRILVKGFISRYLLALFLFLGRIALVFLTPLLLQKIIRFIDNKDEPTWRGYLYVVGIFLANVGGVFFSHQGLQQLVTASIQMRNATVSAVYRKSLRLSSAARQRFTTGEITNFMSVDSQRLVQSVPFSPFIIMGPLEIVISLCLLYRVVGVSMFAGLGVIVLATPLNLWSSHKAEEQIEKQLQAKDKRIKLMSEILTGIKVLKLSAWEKPFMASVEDIRSKEIGVLRYVAKLWALVNFNLVSLPFLMTLATFVTYVFSDPVNNILSADVIFVSISLFKLIRTPLQLFPLALMDSIKLLVSVRRVSDFLNAEELSEEEYSTPKSPLNCLEVDDASFTWEDPDKPALRDLSLTLRKGELVAVVGMVGAGKSSLLSAILGEMKSLGGQVRLEGSRAYVSQQAWIQNMTVRENILFGRELELERYNRVLEVCGLGPDLELMTAGDQTEIGENGINLSGGQKQRVALARAVYQEAELVLLDDPLAALDAHVGKAVFREVIGPEGVLRNTTRLLVTHNISVLNQVDRILVIRDGLIEEQGSYQELVVERQGPFAEFMAQYEGEARKERNNEEGSDSASLSWSEEGSLLSRSVEERRSLPQEIVRRAARRTMSESVDTRRGSLSKTDESKIFAGEVENKLIRISRQVSETRSYSEDAVLPVVEESSDTARLTEDEEVQTGEVRWTVFLQYIRDIGISVFSFNFILFIICEGADGGANYVLSRWADDPNRNDEGTRDQYMMIYGGMGVALCFIFFFKELVLFLACASASKKIHEKLLNKVMHSPMSFFDTNPIGRILNRFSSDIDTVDQDIPFQLDDMLNCVLEVVTILVIISYSTPYFILVLLPLGLAYVTVQKLYIASSRQLKRLDMISKSPIFSHFTETVTGASSIRAFQATERFVDESESLVDTNNRCLYLSFSSNRWLGVRLESVGNLIILGAGLMAVLARDSLSPGLAGLSISYSLNVTETLNWLVRMICGLETNAVSLERIFEYKERREEAAWETQQDTSLPDNWPTSGELEISNLTTRYRESLPPVLNGLNVSIKSGEKVGICGRTGAGKSSLSLVLFRMLEADQGQVKVDGQDLACMGLQKLRRGLTIIPQDPVLFSSSLRFNLDPGSEYSDGEIERCLRLAGMGGLELDMQVQERGENFSVGQRQLLCLARALLRSSRLLIMDEATAAVDLETDDLVQKTIREQFQTCTVLTIAHRLNTILDSDRVLVLEKGAVKEFDKPDELLSDKNSIFYSLAKESGLI